MTKIEWIKIYDILNVQFQKFLEAYPDYLNGKNKKLRDIAEKSIQDTIRRVDFWIRKENEVYFLLTNHGIVLDYDEFLRPSYFKNDMEELLSKMKKIIEEYNE
jgi:hypothetical protein